MTYTVITVCLNSARTIGRTIDSVLRQVPVPAEYVFVDGGSTDGTQAIIQSASERSQQTGIPTRFQLLDQAGGRGITPAWNQGIDASTSDLVFILNSDDWYEEGCASRVLDTFAVQPDADILFASIRAYLRGATKPARIFHNRPTWLFPVLMPFNHPATFVRRNVYNRIGRFDPNLQLLADYDFLYRCHRASVPYVTIDEPLVNFELGGSANRNRPLARHEMLAVARRHGAPAPFPQLVFLARALLGR